jgi:hypothetical protein
LEKRELESIFGGRREASEWNTASGEEEEEEEEEEECDALGGIIIL